MDNDTIGGILVLLMALWVAFIVNRMWSVMKDKPADGAKERGGE